MARQLDFGGFAVRDTTSAALTRFLDRRTPRSPPLAIGFANHNFIVTCQPLERSQTDRRGILLVNDGIGLQIAAKIKYGRGFRENMNGTDFTPYFLTHSKRALTVYLLGSTPDVVEKASVLIGGFPNCNVVGRCDGYSLWAREAEIVDEIRDLRPDALLVGLGNPRQEEWILRHRAGLHVGLIFAVGALFEWISASRTRAPLWIRRARLEWVYRLALEPRRLAKRYTVDVCVFFWLVLGRRSNPAPPRTVP